MQKIVEKKTAVYKIKALFTTGIVVSKNFGNLYTKIIFDWAEGTDNAQLLFGSKRISMLWADFIGHPILQPLRQP